MNFSVFDVLKFVLNLSLNKFTYRLITVGASLNNHVKISDKINRNFNNRFSKVKWSKNITKAKYRGENKTASCVRMCIQAERDWGIILNLDFQQLPAASCRLAGSRKILKYIFQVVFSIRRFPASQQLPYSLKNTPPPSPVQFTHIRQSFLTRKMTISGLYNLAQNKKVNIPHSPTLKSMMNIRAQT